MVKKLRAISPSLEGRSSTPVGPRVSAEALRMAIDAASSDRPCQQSSPSTLVLSRSDRPARERVFTLGRISPAAAKRAAAAAATGSSDAQERDEEVVPARGGSSPPIPLIGCPTPWQLPTSRIVWRTVGWPPLPWPEEGVLLRPCPLLVCGWRVMLLPITCQAVEMALLHHRLLHRPTWSQLGSRHCPWRV